ncbi:hypothetical protein SH2C18_13340 [Clostridium sediminicola]
MYKTKKSIILFVTNPLKLCTSIVITILSVFILFQLLMYNKSRMALYNAEKLIKVCDYSTAYTQLIDFKKENKYKHLEEKAEKRINELITLSNSQFLEGIEILKNDRSNNFVDTETFFINYKKAHPYTENLDKVNSILNLIEEYSEVNIKITELNTLNNYLEANEDVIETLQTYLYDSNELYILSKDIVYKNNKSSLAKLLTLIDSNLYYYKDMVLEISSLEATDIKYTLFQYNEYESIKNIVNNSVMPALSLYEKIVLNKSNKSFYDSLKPSFAKYEKLQPTVTKIIDDKNKFIKMINTEKEKYKKESDRLYKEILSNKTLSVML